MSKKILLIEDEEIIADFLQRKLIKEGYEVSTAVNGEKGLKLMKEEKPDLILLDISLPTIGGFEVMRRKNKDKEISEIPVIIISNSGEPIELEEAEKLGARDWLIKAEFDPQEVLEKVVKQIGR